MVGGCSPPGPFRDSRWVMGRLTISQLQVSCQFMRTPAYIQITGWIDNTKVNLAANDGGGELDPHGADYLGNPLGGLVYSTSLPSGDNTTYQQTQSWNQFFNGPTFCMKLCDPNWTGDDHNYCQKYAVSFLCLANR